MCKLEVNIKSVPKNYPIFINNHDIEKLKDEISDYIGDKNFIVVMSQKVYKLYANTLKFPKEKIFILKDGEKEKNIKNYAKILDFALKHRLTREVPTTLLACTDSSVGGKTAINTSYGKNLVGAFYQPCGVFINVNFLKTLDNRQFKSGLGEVVKYGFIEKSCLCDEELNLMNFLNENAQNILNRDILTLADLIKICIKLKIAVVNQDEKEKGLRKILNYGHTYGHAIEKITNYRKFTHGECVIGGILFALNLAFKSGKIDKEYKFLCEDLISKFDFPKIPKFDKNKILDIMKTDKKAGNDYITFILPTDYASVEAFKYTIDQISL